jgi:hypothetical protein
MYFARACILAIFADHPAARKCTLTGSACPVCFTPEKKMSLAEQEPRHSLKRTHAHMMRRKTILTQMGNTGAPKAKERAKNLAASLGVNMDKVNAWNDANDNVEVKVFGPCEEKDNIFQCTPQPNLHGFDEGLVNKGNAGVLEATIKEAYENKGIKATQV